MQNMEADLLADENIMRATDAINCQNTYSMIEIHTDGNCSYITKGEVASY